ncbi:hypothetical protein GCM10020331_010690 [Ectobacillus funiculus]
MIIGNETTNNPHYVKLTCIGYAKKDTDVYRSTDYNLFLLFEYIIGAMGSRRTTMGFLYN